MAFIPFPLRQLRLAALLLLPLLAGCGPASFELKIPREEIEPRLIRQFPVEKTRGALTLTLSHPRLHFDSVHNRIGLDADLVFAMQDQPPGGGDVSLDAAPAYGAGTLTLNDVAVHSLNLSGLSGENAEVMKRVLSQALALSLEGMVIYKANPDEMGGMVSRSLAGIRVTDEGLVLRFEPHL